MKKTLLIISTASAMAIMSCNQEAATPNEELISQKVTDKYGAELDNYTKLKEMECEMNFNQAVSDKLAESQAAAQ